MSQASDQTTASPADFRRDRAVQLAKELRTRQLNAAAIREAAPDATAEQRSLMLQQWSADSPHSELDQQPSPAAPARRAPRAFLRPRRGKGKQHAEVPTGTSVEPPPAAPQVPDSLTVIPRPGARAPRIGRSRSWVTRLALVVSPLLLIGGMAYSCGVSVGSARLAAPSAISPAEAAQYHLNAFPAEQASAFAASYLTLCLTHPDPRDEVAVAERLAGLSRMTSAGVSAGCGWTDPPTSRTATPDSATLSPTPAPVGPLNVVWDGTAAPIPGYTDGAAAQLGFTITTVDGRVLGASVPVWVSSTASRALRVVGEVAIVPAAQVMAAPTPSAPPVTDSQLSSTLTTTVLLPFLRAWSASDPVQLGLVLAPGSEPSTRIGMNGELSNPRLDNTQLVVRTGDPGAYQDQDQVTALITVDWTARSGGTQRTGYSVDLVMVGGRWQVQAIAGAAPDPAGGAAAATTYPTPSTTSVPPAG